MSEQHTDSELVLIGFGTPGQDLRRATEEETQANLAERRLIQAGAVNKTKEDGFGDTKSGWWMDTVFLGDDARVAWSALQG